MKSTGIWVTSVLSILYIAIILYFRGYDAWNLLQTGNLNELSDFLAGFFTPLAFGWLAYGYLLQSKELRLQREELSLTREQLGKQTELLQEQVEIYHQGFMPCLTVRIANRHNQWDWILENKGGNAKDVQLAHLANLGKKQVIEERTTMPRNDSFLFTLPGAGLGDCYEALFSSEHSERFRQCWEIRGGNCKEITHGPEPLGAEE